MKVFLASPGDLRDERASAKLIVDEFNSEWADNLGYHVELVGWEDTVSVFARPQATINQELARCELFVGMMWKKWGTPPDLTGTYTSGFEEEYSISVNSKETTGRPEISLFFKAVASDQLSDPGEELKRVISFREKIIAEKKVYFETFEGMREFERKFRRRITKYIQTLQRDEERNSSANSKKEAIPRDRGQDLTVEPLSNLGANFIKSLASKLENETSEDPITTTEVARFRLLSALAWRPGNDEDFIGAHDANIIFTNRDDITLGPQEIGGMVEAGLRFFSSGNVPLWHWYTLATEKDVEVLMRESLFGNSTPKRVGALSAMTLISEPIIESDDSSRADLVNLWFESEVPADIKVAALRYLGRCGTPADIPIIKAEFERANYQTASTAYEALIRIRLRESRRAAIETLFELQSETVNEDLLGSLFEKESSLPTELLIKGAFHRSPKVRTIIARILIKRGALAPEMADTLLADISVDVRYEIMLHLGDKGRAWSDDEAKKLLVKAQNSGLSPGNPDESLFQAYKLKKFRAMPEKALEKISTDQIFDRTVQFVIAEKNFAKHGDEIRTLIRDRFKNDFSERVAEFGKKYSTNLEDMLKGVEAHLTKKFTRGALDILARKGDANDLELYRETLGNDAVDTCSVLDVEFLKKFGGWEDIPTIIKLVERFDGGSASLLMIGLSNEKYRITAQAIYHIGRKRLADVIPLLPHNRLMSVFLSLFSAQDYKALGDNMILELLRSTNDDVRKTTAIKAVSTFSKKKMRKLLTTYINSGGFRYYNVIHWLDFGISLPRERSLEASARMLTELKA
ncbi:MAG TPA: hypothetical protein VIM56_02845 [Rhizomicrobium sp.]